MKVTTKDIIKWLPLEKELKQSLLEEWDTYNEDKRYVIEDSLWEMYDMFYKMRVEENLQKAFLHAQEGKGEMDKQFYARVKRETDEQLDKEMREHKETTDLAEARRAMDMIMKEIHAAKKH